jgi:hypothetical protein
MSEFQSRPAADCSYRGHKVGLWLFAGVALLKIGIGVDAVTRGYVMATAGDRVPLGTFTLPAARTVIALYALWGLEHFMLGVVAIIVLARHRAMISFMFIVFLLEHALRLVIVNYLPMATGGTGGDSPGLTPAPYGFVLLIALGLVASVWNQGNHSGGN